MTILAVDDSASSLALISQVVGKLGAVEKAFSNPQDAIVFSIHNDLDLAVVDYDMPQMNGVTLTRRLRCIPRHEDLPIVMVTANESSQVRYEALEAGVTDFLRKPFDRFELTVRLRNILALRTSQLAVKLHAQHLEEAVRASTITLVKREEEIILRLSRAAEFRDTDTGQHIVRMATYCRLLAKELGFTDRGGHMLYLAAKMHDIGKMAISDEILRKSGQLTVDERRQMEQHTLLGHSILSGSECELLKLGAEIALRHHERWDGKGYPNGLAGEGIPLAARIAAVADVFDALTTRRPYKGAWSPEEARDFIAQGAGTQFDPRCVAALFAAWQAILGVCVQRPDQVERASA